jgi:adenylosuccinate lyase
LKKVETNLICLKNNLKRILVRWKTVGKALGQFENYPKLFGSVEKAIGKTLGLLKNHVWKNWVC